MDDSRPSAFEPPPAYSATVSSESGQLPYYGHPGAPSVATDPPLPSPPPHPYGIPGGPPVDPNFDDVYLSRLRAAMTQQPITTQPGMPNPNTPEIRWAQLSPEIAAIASKRDLPQGLEWLVGLSRVNIKQVIDILEIATPMQLPNRYYVENEHGETLYVTTEQMNLVRAQMKLNRRAYKFDMYDQNNKLAFRAERPEADVCCWCGCCEGCRVRSIVESPVGTLAGVITTGQSCCSTNLSIADGDGRRILKMSGPSCCGRCNSDSVFELDAVGGPSGVCTITRKFIKDITTYTNADAFWIRFPPEMDVRLKATIIGTCILIDFIEFEGTKHVNRNR